MSNDDLNKIEELFKMYKDSLLKKKEVITSSVDTDHSNTDSFSTSTAHLITETQSTSCAYKVQLKYDRCLQANISSQENRRCVSDYAIDYSTCFFGETLKHGSKDPELCDAYCTFNHDQCVINSKRLEIFICMGARDTCKSHCPSCGDSGEELIFEKKKRGDRGDECKKMLCNRRKLKCLEQSTSKEEEELCYNVNSLCNPICL